MVLGAGGGGGGCGRGEKQRRGAASAGLEKVSFRCLPDGLTACRGGVYHTSIVSVVCITAVLIGFFLLSRCFLRAGGAVVCEDKEACVVCLELPATEARVERVDVVATFVGLCSKVCFLDAPNAAVSRCLSTEC